MTTARLVIGLLCCLLLPTLSWGQSDIATGQVGQLALTLEPHTIMQANPTAHLGSVVIDFDSLAAGTVTVRLSIHVPITNGISTLFRRQPETLVELTQQFNVDTESVDWSAQLMQQIFIQLLELAATQNVQHLVFSMPDFLRNIDRPYRAYFLTDAAIQAIAAAMDRAGTRVQPLQGVILYPGTRYYQQFSQLLLDPQLSIIAGEATLLLPDSDSASSSTAPRVSPLLYEELGKHYQQTMLAFALLLRSSRFDAARLQKLLDTLTQYTFYVGDLLMRHRHAYDLILFSVHAKITGEQLVDLLVYYAQCAPSELLHDDIAHLLLYLAPARLISLTGSGGAPRENPKLAAVRLLTSFATAARPSPLSATFQSNVALLMQPDGVRLQPILVNNFNSQALAPWLTSAQIAGLPVLPR